MSINNPVHTLNPEVARKIAAGEVIDRPNAIVRELIDNAIDSGAKNITVEISGGGIEKIRIIDDGCGMTKEDLLNCAKPHATSKISSEVDLMNLSTLGFRGEALASVAAVARLSIISSGWKMRASITEDHILEPVAPVAGTIVQSEGLFENFPARRQFLKRAATEGLMCKNTFIEKAMARTDISFRFIMDGETKINLPAGQSLSERFISANSYSEPVDLFYEINGSDGQSSPDWSFNVVIGEPSVSRSNKKEIFIYANGRRIQEYSLVQAVEYGGQGYFPNGTYPVAAVFVNVRPDLVDFNIHPAKKEARFYDISALHHGLSSSIKTFFQNYTTKNMVESQESETSDDSTGDLFSGSSLLRENTFSMNNSSYTGNSFASGIKSSLHNSESSYNGSNSFSISGNSSLNSGKSYQTHISYKNNTDGGRIFNDYRTKYMNSNENTSVSDLAEEALSIQNNQPVIQKPVKFIGSCLGTFLLAEKNNCLYIVDQHAAHERVLFDKIMNNQDGQGRQPLLIPYKIHTESKTQDNQLEKLQPRLNSIGFETNKVSDGYWEINSVPERWTGTEYDLRSLIFVKHVEPEEIIRSIAAMTACKAAVKDGYVLDDETAAKLVEKAFELEDPHCPHGRPVFTVLSREKLFELVKRT